MQQDDKSLNEPTSNPEGFAPLQARIVGLLKLTAWTMLFLAMMYVMHGPQA